VPALVTPVSAQQQKPNILFIMGDDIGIMQPHIYHRGLMVGETPNIDRIGNEGAIFMTYYAEQSCTAGGLLAWAVFAPTQGFAPGALAGEYVGASGDIGLGVGVGANVLLGGSGRTFALQPLSLEGSVAVNVALGVSMLKLRAM
jgi:hypothetical protein